MGYGSRCLELLQKYYEGKIVSMGEGEVAQEATIYDEQTLGDLTEELKPRKNLPPLLLKLSERPPEKLDYLGVSYGLTAELLK